MKKIVILIIGILAFPGCDDNFLEEIPRDFISTETYFRNQDDAVAAVNAVYNAMAAGDYWRYYTYTDLTTEVVTTWVTGLTANNQSNIDCYLENATDGTLEIIWNYLWPMITRANYVLKNVGDMDESKFDDTSLKGRVMGEAYFIRALTYFDLVRFFGGVPLRLEALESITDAEPKIRNTDAEVYIQIISDLKEAIKLLPQNSAYSSKDLGRASKGAAKALLAKVYLQRGSLSANNGITGARQIAESDDFKNAAAYCQEVIDDGEYNLIAFKNLWGFDAVGNDLNDEIIFTKQHSTVTKSNRNLYRYVNLRFSDLPSSPTQYWQPNLDFYLSFSSNDIRKDVIFYTQYVLDGNTVTYDMNDPLNDGYYSDTPAFLKYVSRNETNETDEVVLRYADILLMKAEALNEVNNGPTEDAYDGINQVRNRAGLDNLPSGLTYTAFKDSVYIERQKEFVMEGQGWFDCQRNFSFFKERQEASDNFGLSPRFGPILEVVVEDPKHRIWPIPQAAIDREPTLEQSEGWK